MSLITTSQLAYQSHPNSHLPTLEEQNKAAFNKLYEWLHSSQPKQNRHNFGNYVRLWLRRQGKFVSRTSSADKIALPNLHDALLPTFREVPDSGIIVHGLGSLGYIAPCFWFSTQRLHLTLDFMGITALDAVIDLNIEEKQPNYVPTVNNTLLTFLDALWTTKQCSNHKRVVFVESRVKHFGTWLNQLLFTHTTAQCNKRALAFRLAPTVGWSKNATPNGRSYSASASISKLFAGKLNVWSLATLTILVKFANYKNDTNWTPEELITEYNTWCQDNPLPQ